MTYTMKDSGVDWIGMIPEHWDINQISNLGKVQTGNTPTKKDDSNYIKNGFPWITPNDLKDFHPILFSKLQLSEKGKKVCRIIKKNSVLVCCIGSIGKIGIAGCDLSTNQQINSISFYKKYYYGYGKYVVYASKYEHEKLSNKNVIAIINSSRQKKILFPVPPKKEQEAIATYLDKHVGNIDKYVEVAEKKIELLKEQKTSLINETVTRGLNPDVKMKDSGIEWIGVIPEHWKVERVKRFFHFINGSAFNDKVWSKQGYKIVRIQNLNGSDKYNLYNNDVSKKVILNQGDILLSWSASVDVYRWNQIGNFLLNQHIYKVETKNNLSKNYSFWLLKFLIEEIKNGMHGTAMTHITKDKLNNIVLICPPPKEQEAIATYLDKKCSRIDSEVSILTEKVALLKEYKTSLIYEVVTGKKSVV